jgi:hypothetical protein
MKMCFENDGASCTSVSENENEDIPENMKIRAEKENAPN